MKIRLGFRANSSQNLEFLGGNLPKKCHNNGRKFCQKRETLLKKKTIGNKFWELNKK